MSTPILYANAQQGDRPAPRAAPPLVDALAFLGTTAVQRRQEYPAANLDFYRRIKGELVLADVQQPLTRENYKEKFHKLLCWEEKTHIEILEERYHNSLRKYSDMLRTGSIKFDIESQNQIACKM